MAALTVTSLALTGLADIDGALESAAGGGDTFTYSPRTALIIFNGDCSAKTVTISAQTSSTTASGFGSVSKADYTIVVAAGDYAITPFMEQVFNNSSGNVEVTYSAVTSVSVAAISFPELTTR